MQKLNVAILIFEDVEVLDFAGPFEVFAVASELRNHEPFHVYTVAEQAQPVRARNGMVVLPDFSVDDAPSPDILIVPGGFGTRKVMKNEFLVGWVQKHALQEKLTLSVCTGALVLAAAGLLDGMEVTTHHENLEMLQEMLPTGKVTGDKRFVDNGMVVTAGGISAGIDMSLHVVGRLLGEEAVKDTLRYMEYGDWR